MFISNMVALFPDTHSFGIEIPLDLRLSLVYHQISILSCSCLHHVTGNLLEIFKTFYLLTA